MELVVKEGVEFDTAANGRLVVVNYKNAMCITVKFLDTGYVCLTTARRVRDGVVKDYLRPSVSGVGFIGDGKHKAKDNGELTTEYKKWSSMIGRCYNKKERILFTMEVKVLVFARSGITSKTLPNGIRKTLTLKLLTQRLIKT